MAILTTDSEASVRDAYRRPTIVVNTDIFDDKALDKIPDFDFLYEYIFKHNLVDIIVEFALFNIPLGINNERIVIFELRTHY